MTPFFSRLRGRHLLAPLLLAPALSASFNTSASAQLQGVQVGSGQAVNFGQALISNSCTMTTSDGSLGVRSNRSQITSDSAESGTYNGTLAAANISATSNLSNTAFVQVDNPTLKGTTAATTAQVRFSGGAWGDLAQVNLGSDGTLATTPLHVKFTTTNGNGRFANGTYTASATVSCYDGI